MPDFDSVNLGSNPSPPATNFYLYSKTCSSPKLGRCTRDLRKRGFSKWRSVGIEYRCADQCENSKCATLVKRLPYPSSPAASADPDERSPGGRDCRPRPANKNQTFPEDRHEDRLRSIRSFACRISSARPERQDHAHRLAPRRAVRERPRDHFRGPDRRPLSLRHGAERNRWRRSTARGHSPGAAFPHARRPRRRPQAEGAGRRHLREFGEGAGPELDHRRSRRGEERRPGDDPRDGRLRSQQGGGDLRQRQQADGLLQHPGSHRPGSGGVQLAHRPWGCFHRPGPGREAGRAIHNRLFRPRQRRGALTALEGRAGPT